jgi:hypothetical protein
MRAVTIAPAIPRLASRGPHLKVIDDAGGTGITVSLIR